MTKELSSRSNSESQLGEELKNITAECLSRFTGEWNNHLLVTLKRQTLSRVLYWDQLYRRILGKPGVICEFGVQWGASLAQLINLRGIYEPYNISRLIYGFDTFSGFVSVDKKDGGFSEAGDYATSKGYEETLESLLNIHEAFCPVSHKKKFELIKGDASVTVQKWLADNPSAIISMAIFDMDVYKPTRDVLEAIIPRLTKGSLLVFDELNCPTFPGETRAVDEILKLNNLRLEHFPHQPYCAWAVFGD
jgi:Macrocin-O-methyltransferase (TylF)